jgi:hypothetical protein
MRFIWCSVILPLGFVAFTVDFMFLPLAVAVITVEFCVIFKFWG